MAAGDELVYRLILDSQDNTTGPSQGASRPKATTAAADASEEALAFQQARARRTREDQAELADQAYRAMKSGSPLGKVQDADHQAKLDKLEAEAERQRDLAREIAAKSDPAQVAKQLIERQAFAENVRLNAAAQKGGISVDEQKEKEENDRIRAEARKNLDDAEAEAARVKKEADRAAEAARKEAEQQRKMQQAQDPKFLASEAIKQQQLYEQTRLQIEATKQGTTPEEIANREKREEQFKQTGGTFRAASTTAAHVMRADAIGAISDAASLHPVGAMISQGLNQVVGAIKANAADYREQNKRMSRFSPELTKTNAMENIKDTLFFMKLAQEQGGERSKLESERRELEREKMRTGAFSQRMEILFLKLDVTLNTILDKLPNWNFGLGAGGMVDAIKEGLKGKNAAAQPKQAGGILGGLPPAFKFQKDGLPPGFKVENNPGIGPVKIPMLKPRGLMNPAMPGV